MLEMDPCATRAHVGWNEVQLEYKIGPRAGYTVRSNKFAARTCQLINAQVHTLRIFAQIMHDPNNGIFRVNNLRSEWQIYLGA